MKKTGSEEATTSRLALASIVLGILAAGCATSSPSAGPSAPAARTTELPRTSDVAVAAFHREFPGAVLDEAVRPTGFADGDGVEPPLFWVVRHHTGDARDEAQITPDGILVHRQTKLAMNDVPAAVAAAISGASSGAAPATATRHETMARLGYVALPTPHVSWLATVEKQGKVSRFIVKGDGSVRRGGDDEEDEGDEAGEEKESEKPAAAPKEIEIPAEAARAVAAVKDVYPQAIVTAVETVPVDDGTGRFDVLQYEVEFSLGDEAKQTLATPDGIVLRTDRPVAMDSLPGPVSAAISKEAAGGKVRSVVQVEDHGDLRFLRLAEPRVVYEAVLETNGKTVPARFTPEGRRIQPILPGRQAAAAARAPEKEEDEEGAVDVREIAQALKVALPDAIAAAVANRTGEALEAGLEGETKGGKREVFVEVMIVDAAGDAIEVKIDPASGGVLSAGKSDETDEPAELGAVLKSLPAGHLPLVELARRAATSVEGRMVSAAYLAKKGGGAVGTARFLVGKQMWQVTLDPATGAVLTKRTVAGDEEDESDEEREESESPARKK